MKNTGRMYVFEATQHLIEEKLCMVISEGLIAPDDALEVSLHEIVHQIDVLELLF